MEFPAINRDHGNDSGAATPGDGDVVNNSSSPGRHQTISTGILSQISFPGLAPFSSGHGLPDTYAGPASPTSPSRAEAGPRSSGVEVAKQTRRRKGSLRKVALLSRGASREKLENRAPGIEAPSTQATNQQHYERHQASVSPAPAIPEQGYGHQNTYGGDAPSTAGSIRLTPLRIPSDSHQGDTARHSASGGLSMPSRLQSPQIQGGGVSYASTTDEEDALHIPERGPPLLALGLSRSSSGSEAYLPHRMAAQRRRSVQRAKSPLSFGGLPTTALPSDDADWDYSETEWWGWVVLVVTWFVFVIGMGSSLGVWSWAWDVGTTPYAPPELEDDPSLPITGYYPALAILSCIMAWVWVVVAWVGMKYFRHAKISGD